MVQLISFTDPITVYSDGAKLYEENTDPKKGILSILTFSFAPMQSYNVIYYGATHFFHSS